ncbi:MAG: hypothetical protein DIU65_05270 [Proteobacteria bacterium]|jgi:hypothetical protein|nr:MAG: hypothetical protein DIU65_05270 [Pseudomonadota bacterium]
MPERHLGRRDREKREDLAIIIPAFGAVLLMPLLINLFVIRERIFGVPLEVAYLFGVWLLLVGGAVGLVFWLPDTGSTAGSTEEEVGSKTPSELA